MILNIFMQFKFQIIFFFSIIINIMIFFYFLLTINAIAANTNLICNGDFQAYVLTDSYQGDYYLQTSSNLSCWYNKITTQIIEIKLISSPYSTKGAELTTDKPYTLCQKVNLQVGVQYLLSYSLLCPNKLTKMTLQVYLNNIKISELYISSSNTFGNQEVRFISTISVNQICFKENHSVNFFYSLKNFVGGVVDNISLVEVASQTTLPIEQDRVLNETESIPSQPQKETKSIPSQPQKLNSSSLLEQQQKIPHQIINVIIHFTTVVKEIGWQIELHGDLVLEDWTLQYLKKGMRIFIEEQEQKDYYFTKDQNQKIVIVAKVFRNYDISEIQIVVQNKDEFKNFLTFSIYLNGKKIYFNLLNQQEKAIIDTASEVANVMPDIVFKTYQIISTSFASFFVLSLFNFWNLSLMYNFLLFKVTPNFTRNIYEVMLNLLYQKGSFTSWLLNFITDQQNPLQFLEKLDEKQKMLKYKQGYSWFGQFGLSTISLVNNFDFALLFGFLFIKIFAFMIIIHFLSEQKKQILEIKERYSRIILLQISSYAPFVIISAFTAVSESSETIIQKKQTTIQCTLLFLSLSILPLIFYSSSIHIKSLEKKSRYFNKKYDSMKEEIKTLTKIKFSAIQQEIRKDIASQKLQRQMIFGDLILNFTIPGVIWLGAIQGFLFFNIVIIFLKCLIYFYNFKKIRILDKIYLGTMNFIWIVHHSNYIGFYILETLKNKNSDIQVSQIVVVCGIIAFMTVIIGGAVELLKVIIDALLLIKFIVSKLIIFYEKWKKKQKELDFKKNIFQKSNQSIRSPQRQIQIMNFDEIKKSKSKIEIELPLEKEIFIPVQKCNFTNSKTGYNFPKQGLTKIQMKIKVKTQKSPFNFKNLKIIKRQQWQQGK